MAAFNRVIIAGNLTRDPEYRSLTSGQGVCRLGIATNRQFKNKQTGSMVQEAKLAGFSTTLCNGLSLGSNVTLLLAFPSRELNFTNTNLPL